MPYWRLSGLYAVYFASIGALIPYWGLYLESSGFSAQQIGALLALLMASKIVSPNIWAWIADHSGRRMPLVRFGSFTAMVVFALGMLGQGFGWMALVMVLFGFFWNATLPQIEATTFNYLGHDTHRYSVVRVWGSIGFVVAVVLLGVALDRYGMALLPPVLVVLMAGIWGASLLVSDKKPSVRAAEGHKTLRSVLKQPAVLGLLFTCFLVQASHGPYYTFFTIYLEDHGYSRSLAGQLWALGVVAEVAVFLVAGWLITHVGPRKLLLLSLLLTTIRWLLIGLYVDEWFLLLIAQLLHAASFGLYHVAAIYLIHHFFVGRYQGRGQALYSSFSFGAGGALGSLFSGFAWSAMGGGTFLVGAFLSAAAFGVAWRYVDYDQDNRAPEH
ncbi:MAG: MFS transporter [Gammaproteobacteria bacterium]|nr:MFS transporter [Gammaproteobacteria bacterium]